MAEEQQLLLGNQPNVKAIVNVSNLLNVPIENDKIWMNYCVLNTNKNGKLKFASRN